MVTIGNLPSAFLFSLEGETYLTTNQASKVAFGHRHCVNVRTGIVESLIASRLARVADLAFAANTDYEDRPIAKADL